MVDKNEIGVGDIIDYLKNIKDAAAEVANWSPWKVRNIRLAFSEDTI